MQSSKMKAKDGSTIELVDNRISDGDIASWNNKLNVDGSNATPVGVTDMMRKVPSGTGTLSDESSYFGDSDSDHAKIVRRPVLDIWNYVKDNLGSAGSKDRPVYFDGGVPQGMRHGTALLNHRFGVRDRLRRLCRGKFRGRLENALLLRVPAHRHGVSRLGRPHIHRNVHLQGWLRPKLRAQVPHGHAELPDAHCRLLQ